MNLIFYIKLYVSTYILLNVHKAWTITAPSNSDPGSSIGAETTGDLGNDPSRTGNLTNVPASKSTPGFMERARSRISNLWPGNALGPFKTPGERQTLHNSNGKAVDAPKFRESTWSTQKHIPSLERTITEAEIKIKTLVVEKDKKEKDMKDAQKKILTPEIIESAIKIKEKLQNLSSKNAEYIAEESSLQGELNELKESFDLQQNIDAEKQSVLKKKLEETENDIKKCNEDILKKNDHLAFLNLTLDEIRGQNNQAAQAQEAIQLTQDAIANSKKELNDLGAILFHKILEKDLCVGEINNLKTDAIDDITSKIKVKEDEIDGLRSEHDKLNGQIKSLESQMNELNAEVIPENILELFQNGKTLVGEIDLIQSFLTDYEEDLKKRLELNKNRVIDINDPNLDANSKAIIQIQNLIKETKLKLHEHANKAAQLNTEFSSAIDNHNIKARQDYVNLLKDFEYATTDYIDAQKKLAKYQEELIEVYKNSKPQELAEIQDMITRFYSDEEKFNENKESIKNLTKSKNELEENYENSLKGKNEEISEIKEKLNEALKNLAESENEKDKIQEDLKTIQNDLEEIIKKRDENLLQLNKEIDIANRKCQAQENDLATLNEEIKKLKENYENEKDITNKEKIKIEIEKLEKSLVSAEEELEASTIEYQRLQNEKEFIEKRCEKKITELTDQMRKIIENSDLNVKKLEQAYEEIKKLQSELNESNTNLNIIFDGINNNYASVRKYVDELENHNKNINAQLIMAKIEAVEGQKYFNELTKLRISQIFINNELAKKITEINLKDIEIKRLNQAINKAVQKFNNEKTDKKLLKNRIKQFKRKFQQIISNTNPKNFNASKVLDIFEKIFDKNDLNADSDDSNSSTS
ncbi:hypothetical protein COBT_002827, partial [Conglomerata obtusa]